MVSARDLSNLWTSGSTHLSEQIIAYLLQNLHGQLGRDRPTSDKFIKRVSQGHADSIGVHSVHHVCLLYTWERTTSPGKIRSKLWPL